MDHGHRIELVRHRPGPALTGLCAGMVGISERASGVVRRRQPAGTLLPLVVSFGRPLEVESLSEGTGAGTHASFVAGFSAGHASTWFDSGQDCVQVYLTPLGVRRVLGVPGQHVADRVVAAGDVVRALGDDLSDRVASAPTWEERFTVVEDALLHQVARSAEPPRWVAWMWQQIRLSGGQHRVGDLVARTGWSHRHVATVFREEVGLTPKRAARVVRFERAAADLGRLPLAEVAARHGYTDQSHLTRDTLRHAGETPAVLAAARRPTPARALARASGSASLVTDGEASPTASPVRQESPRSNHVGERDDPS